MAECQRCLRLARARVARDVADKGFYVQRRALDEANVLVSVGEMTMAEWRTIDGALDDALARRIKALNAWRHEVADLLAKYPVDALLAKEEQGE